MPSSSGYFPAGALAWRFAIALTFVYLPRAQVARGAEPPPLSTVTPDAEWNAVFDRTEGWTGADAAGSVDLGDGRTLWMFGDTWIGKIQGGTRLPGARMVNNSIAVHPTSKASYWRPPDPRSVQFLWGPPDKENQPTAWLVPPRVPGQGTENGDWFWATGGGVVAARENGQARRLIVFLFRTRRDPQGKGVWSFATAGTSLAVIDNVSEPPERWQPRIYDVPGTGRVAGGAGSRSPIETFWGMSACAPDETSPLGGRLLICGTRKSGLFDMALVMARVPAGSIERFNTWSFVADSGPANPRPAVPRSIAKGLVSEFSVERLEIAGRTTWVLIQSEPLLGKRIFARTATRPEGPWSPPRTIYTVPDVARSRQYFTYAAKGHASFSRPGELLVTYLVNSQNFGDLVHDTTIYHPKFLRVPVAALLEK
jgi:hypothetical protein